MVAATTMVNSRGKQWKHLYRRALIELDPQKLATAIQEAQEAIQARILELSQDHGGGAAERHDLDDAIRNLHILARELRHDPSSGA